MKLLVTITFLIFSFSVFAGCDVYIPSKIFYHDSGIAINLDFTEILSSKAYFEVESERDANFTLKATAKELRGRFKRAEVKISFGQEVAVATSKVCLTQLCSVYDFAQVFNKAMSQFSRSLQACH